MVLFLANGTVRDEIHKYNDSFTDGMIWMSFFRHFWDGVGRRTDFVFKAVTVPSIVKIMLKV